MKTKTKKIKAQSYPCGNYKDGNYQRVVYLSMKKDIDIRLWDYLNQRALKEHRTIADCLKNILWTELEKEKL